jgi:hypothetical protein
VNNKLGFIFRVLLPVAFAVSVPLLHAQTDAKGNSMSDEDIVNNNDPSTTPGGGRSTSVERDPKTQNITRVWVYDSKGRQRREIRINYDPLGNAHVESTDIRADKSEDTQTTTNFAPGLDGRRHPTDRTTMVYPPTGGIVTPNGKPNYSTGWQEKWENGHWVRVAVLKDGQWVPTRKQSSPQEKTISSLLSNKSVNLEVAGTGQTIGHIADFKIQNQTDQPVSFVIPAMVLESSSGKNQHYACPKEQKVTLGPKQSKTVPIDGVCLDRSKPPAGKGVTGDLVINEAAPNGTQMAGSHVPLKDANKMLRIAKSKYDAAEKLQKDGELKEMPYHDKQEQKDIVVQWSIWSDPEISKITGAPPATKDDLKKVVYKQIEEKGEPSPKTKKKIDKGIDTIFEKIELTNEKAKDLEKPDPFTGVELTGEKAKDEGKSPQEKTEEPKP